MITHAIKKEFEKAIRRKWLKIYIFVDLHETILKPNWSSQELSHEYYPEAKELLQELSARPDIILILFTCSHPHEIEQYKINFLADNIKFDYTNENPEIKTMAGDYGCYDKKPYFNILLDDKSGITPDEIPLVRSEFKKHSLLPILPPEGFLDIKTAKPNFSASGHTNKTLFFIDLSGKRHSGWALIQNEMISWFSNTENKWVINIIYWNYASAIPATVLITK